jgi:CBS domain-containing protein
VYTWYHMTVIDFAQRDVVTIRPDQSADELTTLLGERGLGCAVVEEEGSPVGVVTDRDLVMGVLEPRHDPQEVTVAEIMTADPETVHEGASVLETTGLMARAAVRRLPVVDDAGDLVGIVALDDLLVVLAEELRDLAGVVVAETPSGDLSPRD